MHHMIFEMVRCSFGTFPELFSIWVIHSHKRATTCWCMNSSPTNNTGLFHFLKTWVSRRWQKQYFFMSDNFLYFTIHIVSITFIFYPSEHINSLDAVEEIRFSCTSFSNYEDEVSSKCSCWLTTHTSSPPSSTRVQLPESGPDAAELWLSHGFRCPRNSARCLFQNMKDWLDTRVYYIIYDLCFHW